MNLPVSDPHSTAAFIIIGLALLYVGYGIAISIKHVKAGEVGLVEQLGKYRRTLQPGTHLIIPFVERVAYLVKTEPVNGELLSTNLTTKDGDRLQDVIITITWKIVDAAKSTYEEMEPSYSTLNEYALWEFQNIVAGQNTDVLLNQPATVTEQFTRHLKEKAPAVGIEVLEVTFSPFRKA